jgi:hypothetical protein
VSPVKYELDFISQKTTFFKFILNQLFFHLNLMQRSQVDTRGFYIHRTKQSGTIVGCESDVAHGPRVVCRTA